MTTRTSRSPRPKAQWRRARCLCFLMRATAGDGLTRIPLPDVSVRRVHGVAVALGGQTKVPFESGDFGKGYVHVLDETSFRIVASELDTITDWSPEDAKKAEEIKAESGFFLNPAVTKVHEDEYPED